MRYIGVSGYKTVEKKALSECWFERCGRVKFFRINKYSFYWIGVIVGKSEENSQKYWEKVLTESGLSMNRGRPPQHWIDRGTPNERRVETLVYVGTSNNLVGIEEEQIREKSGRVKPKGPAPD